MTVWLLPTGLGSPVPLWNGNVLVLSTAAPYDFHRRRTRILETLKIAVLSSCLLYKLYAVANTAVSVHPLVSEGRRESRISIDPYPRSCFFRSTVHICARGSAAPTAGRAFGRRVGQLTELFSQTLENM